MAEQSVAEQIVVGYDGSENSDRALEWATHHAAALSAGLKIVVSAGRPVAVGFRPDAPYRETTEQEARRAAELAVARVRTLDRRVGVTGVVRRGKAAGVLVHEAEEAIALVLGRRGRRGIRGRVGSVSASAAAHARCPVVVVPEHWDPQVRAGRNPAGPFVGRVVAGVDEPGGDNPAAVAAARCAARRGQGLVLLAVVHEDLSALTGWSDLHRAARERLLEPAQAVVDEASGAVRGQHPRLEVETFVVFGEPAERLVEASRSAALVVVGTRGHGKFRGLLMGSVSQAVLRQAESPVMVVPTRGAD
jgi:nucleotide-binding universal stress UspA family protein